jgi:toxin YoeB
MKLLWTGEAWADYLFWQETDREMLRRINELLKDARRDPFKGLGKPEPLKGDLSGWWSRRITGEHRLVYRVSGRDENRQIEIAACRYHYR